MIVTVEEYGGLWRVWLKIGVQSFNVGEDREERGEAEWYADMLRIALKNYKDE
jgi:hypothetical protein